MADLLGSILGSMEKPPTLGDADRKKAKEQKRRLEKLQQEEQRKLEKIRSQTQQRINEMMKDSKQEHLQFEPMDKVHRAIVHEVADIAGLTSFSFGQDEVDRYVMIWKKEFAPTDEELNAYRKGEAWDAEKAKEIVKQMKEQEQCRLERQSKQKVAEVAPSSNYKDKYEHLIGKVAAKDAAIITTANTSYGFVPSENKRDHRTIEQVMAESRTKKKMRTDQHATNSKNDTADSPTEVDSKLSDA